VRRGFQGLAAWRLAASPQGPRELLLREPTRKIIERAALPARSVPREAVLSRGRAGSSRDGFEGVINLSVQLMPGTIVNALWVAIARPRDNSGPEAQVSTASAGQRGTRLKPHAPGAQSGGAAAERPKAEEVTV